MTAGVFVAAGQATLAASDPGEFASIAVAETDIIATDAVVISLSNTAAQTGTERSPLSQYTFQVIKTASTGFAIKANQPQTPELKFDYLVYNTV